MRLDATLSLFTLCATAQHHQVSTKVQTPWHGTTHQDLHREYYNIFKYGNRNAASHLWSSFLLDRSHQMTPDQLVHLFGGFCAVSGSPVGDRGGQERYRLSLDQVGGGTRSGFMHYCCWPCVCDTQDFIKVDTKTIETSEGERQFHFAVLGNPCDHPEELSKPFADAFGRGMSTLTSEAREVRCGPNGELIGATLSDHGYIIISMFFDMPAGSKESDWLNIDAPRPGRMQTLMGVRYQDEVEFANMCEDRKNAGYNSGMGEIFRKVAAISKVDLRPAIAHTASASSQENESCASQLPDGETASTRA